MPSTFQRVKGRQQILRTVLEAGLATRDDGFLEAAFIFQHGDTAGDRLFAHILAREPMTREGVGPVDCAVCSPRIAKGGWVGALFSGCTVNREPVRASSRRKVS